MTTWALLAPGPSASAELAERLRGFPLGVVGNAFELAPWADFLAATDSRWWRMHPQAKELAGAKYSMHAMPGVAQVRMQGGVVNSGVLALECAKRRGATSILLCGFDMRGSHFFGPYRNGLSNTTDAKRRVHLGQYAAWRKANPGLHVVNLTENSALQCFPMARLDDYCSRIQMGNAGLPGNLHVGACEHTAPHGGAALQEAASVPVHHG